MQEDQTVYPSEQHPKKRGRKPKNLTPQDGVSEIAAATPKKRGRKPKQRVEDVAQDVSEQGVLREAQNGGAADGNGSADFAGEHAEDSEKARARERVSAEVSGGGGSDEFEKNAKSLRAMRRNSKTKFRDLKRDDGPQWRDVEPPKESADNGADEPRDAVFTPAQDEFAFGANGGDSDSNTEDGDSGRRSGSEDGAEFANFEGAEGGDGIPTSYSTTDEDLIQDNYQLRFEEDGGEGDFASGRGDDTAQREGESAGAARDSESDGLDARNRRNNNRFGNRDNQQQNGKWSKGNNRFNRNQNRPYQQTQNQQQNNRFNRNQNRQNQQNGRFGAAQNNQNQNAQKNQNRQSPQNQNQQTMRGKQAKPKWSAGEGDGVMNPTELFESPDLKSFEAIEQFLAREYLGVDAQAQAAQQAAQNGLGEAQGCGASDVAEIGANADVAGGCPAPTEAAQANEEAVLRGMGDAGENAISEIEEADAVKQMSVSEAKSEEVVEAAESEANAGESASGEAEGESVSNDGQEPLSYWDMLERSNRQLLYPEENAESGAAGGDAEAGGSVAAGESSPARENAAGGMSDGAECASGSGSTDGAECAGAKEKVAGIVEAAVQESGIFAPEYDVKIEGAGEVKSVADFERIYALAPKELAQYLAAAGIPHRSGLNKNELLKDFFDFAAEQKKLVRAVGILDVFENGLGGAVVFESDNYRLRRFSVYVPKIFIDKYGLKRGHRLEVLAASPRSEKSCPFAVKVCSVMGGKPENAKDITAFNELVPYYPTRRIIMECDAHSARTNVSMRAVDLISPVGFGQRALIVAPPRTGKTVLMQTMAKSIRANKPEANLVVLLVDERPEEVTDFKRAIDAEVVASTFDEDALSHVHAAEMVISKARRMVECGEDVIILLDSITRLARAYNALMPNGGRTMSGGVEANALQKPKKFFGSARNIEGGGSLTIIATALIETGSKMDEVIFEEFKGTGNLELHLDRSLSDKRIFPAINIEKSGTRKEELLYHPDELEKIYTLRRAMHGVPIADAMEMLMQRLKKTKTNVEFLLGLNR